LDIFFTHSYQYILEEDPGSVATRLTTVLKGSRVVFLAENGFRLGHPWGLSPSGWSDAKLAYLSGTLDPMTPRTIPGDPPLVQPRTLIDIRIRPNLFLVALAYVSALLLILDMVGIELFWKNAYLLRLALVCVLVIGSTWAIFYCIAQLRKQFEVRILSPFPPDSLP
jgi:hypothetical protein